MKNYQKSAYAANKYSENIVYNSEVSGNRSITLDDFLKSDSNLTEEEFTYWKNWSDSNYKEESTVTNRVTKNNVSLSNLDESVPETSYSLEEILENAHEDTILEQSVVYALKKFIGDKRVSKVMKRRFALHFNKGMRYESIAQVDGISRQGATKTINAAFSIFKAYFVEKYLELGGDPEKLL